MGQRVIFAIDIVVVVDDDHSLWLGGEETNEDGNDRVREQGDAVAMGGEDISGLIPPPARYPRKRATGEEAGTHA